MEAYPCLWKLDHPDYRNVSFKNSIWEALASQLNENHGGNITADVLKKVFSIRKKQYQDEKRKKLIVESGQPPRYIGKWRIFSALSFLDTRCPAVQDNSVLGMGLHDVQVKPCAADVSENLLSITNSSAYHSPSSHTQVVEPVVQQASATKNDRLPTLSRHLRQAQQRACHNSSSDRPSALSRMADVLSKHVDECEAFGKLVECRMRRIPPSCYGDFQVEVLAFITRFEQSALNNDI